MRTHFDETTTNIHEKKKLRSSIVDENSMTINEANICHKISKIPYYSNFFSILVDCQEAHISNSNTTSLQKLGKYTKPYYVLYYDDVHSRPFIHYLYSFTSAKILMHTMIDNALHILQGLCVLYDNHLCFFNISYKNILFLDNYREKPVLAHFSQSIRTQHLTYSYISDILKNIDDFTYQPLEIHLLYYFIHQNITTVSYSFIEEFCETFINNLSILHLFSQRYIEQYRHKCIETLKPYINQPKETIISNILERKDKWDVYGYSVLFIHIFGTCLRVFSLKGTFISKLTIALSRNIHPNSENRMTVKETHDTINKLLNEEESWDYITHIHNKMDVLYSELSK